MGPNKIYFQAVAIENVQTKWQVTRKQRKEAQDKKLLFFEKAQAHYS